jgi:adenylosuccinate lyase
MFQTTAQETGNLKSQFAISSWGGRRSLPLAFTEQGVAMLSSVLNSARAIEVNISIMRAFVNLRRVLASSPSLATRMRQVEERLSAHEATLGEHGQAIKEVFADIRKLIEPPQTTKPRRRKARSAKTKLVQVLTTVRA